MEEHNYLNLLQNIATNGHVRQTRNAMTRCLFGNTLSFNLNNNTFPLLTTKKMFFRGIFEELLFFLRGQTNTKLLEDKKVNIWKNNTSREFLDNAQLNHLEEGDMGPLYGFQLRHFGAKYTNFSTDYSGKGFDQLHNVIHLLKTDRFSRRIMMTTYNPSQVKEGPLPPCHGIVIQFGIEGNNKLSCHMHQRSADFFHGVPFNIASYALLVHIICALVNNADDNDDNNDKLEPGKLTISFGDCHIYESHISVVHKQLTRAPHPFPKLLFKKKITSIDNLQFDDVDIVDYTFYPPLKADMVA